MESKELSPALRYLSKWCAVLCLVVIIYPWVFLIPDSGDPYEAMTQGAIMTTHTHLSANTMLLFMVGFLFTFTVYQGAKKLWIAIGAISLLLMSLGLFLGVLILIIVATLVYSISIVVMCVGILIKTP
jgi:4-amino-4-deoxy-L-arabinose transferase-like glycosyltransferase